jgi:transmembrane sensor
MCKENHTVEDFVLDPEFQNWVLHPNISANLYWEEFLIKRPDCRENIITARQIVLHMARKSVVVSEEQLRQTWNQIESKIDTANKNEYSRRVVPLNAETTLLRHAPIYVRPSLAWKDNQAYRMVAILLVAFGMAILVNLYFPSKSPQIEAIAISETVNHWAPPGVKSSFTLSDGSKIMLNAGSSLTYIKGFEPHQRVLELEGEAFFEVAKDPDRPFIVNSRGLTTTALGTSFNIKAYDTAALDIALVSGLVEVTISLGESQQVNLQQGQGIRVDMKARTVSKYEYEEDVLLAWTRKTIIFQKTPMEEIKKTLENWYGVQISYINKPSRDLEISGKFADQSLENVLEGLSHSARFTYSIHEDVVFLTFNPKYMN